MSAYTVLVTKKIAPGFIEKAKEQNVELKELEFTEIVPCNEKQKVDEIADNQSSVVFTSKNSVNIVVSMLEGKIPDWKIFCIDGGTSDQVAASFGEKSIVGTARNAEGLASVIVAKDAVKNIVFFCGDKRRDELPDTLEKKDVKVEEVVVYETKLSPKVIGEHYDGIAFFSPSAAESFFSANVIDDKTIFFSIGSTTSRYLKKYSKNKIITCETASEENMIETILSHIKQTNE